MPDKDQEWIETIVAIVDTAQIVDIDNIIIEPDCIRAIDDNKNVVLFQNEDVPALSIGSIGMNRISTFKQRYNIISKQDSPSFEAKVDKDKKYVRSIVMKSADTKVEYRCANPETIQAPRKINDDPMYRIVIPSSSGNLMKNAQAAMNSEVIEITSDADGVYYQFLDINNDGFKHKFADHALNLEDEDSDAFFTHKYQVKNVLAVINPARESVFEIGKMGIITTSVNGLNILLLPQV